MLKFQSDRVEHWLKTSIVPRDHLATRGTVLVFKFCSTRSISNGWNNPHKQTLFDSLPNHRVEQCLFLSIVPRNQIEILKLIETNLKL